MNDGKVNVYLYLEISYYLQDKSLFSLKLALLDKSLVFLSFLPLFFPKVTSAYSWLENCALWWWGRGRLCRGSSGDSAVQLCWWNSWSLLSVWGLSAGSLANFHVSRPFFSLYWCLWPSEIWLRLSCDSSWNLPAGSQPHFLLVPSVAIPRHLHYHLHFTTFHRAHRNLWIL